MNNSKPNMLAGCIIQDNEKRILLLHRHTRHTQWETPGGSVEAGESASAAAIREVQEELGVTVKIIHTLGEGEITLADRPLSYTWFLGVITDGSLHIAEPHVHDDFRYFSWEEIAQRSDLSPNMVALLSAYQAGTLTL